MYPLLDKIDSPADLKGLSEAQLRQLCEELRDYMVRCCAVNPGHLASSLGAVEIIVGLHRVFHTPEDRIVFDVGHQAYAHKILTGRREAFKTFRTEGGISGFPRPDESPYDAFATGHSSTSISAALGFAEAARLQGEGRKAVAVIGDGALTGGLAFEGMNNAGASKADLLVILNDNNQSIDRNLGGIHEHLLRITTNRHYNRFKQRVWDFLGERRLRGWLQRWLRSLKAWMVKRSGGDIFEALGFRYFGPIDGNDLEQVVTALTRLRDLHGPRVLHCITTKGKGYAPAEADPVTWHAPGRFDPDTGARIAGPHAADRYQDVFGAVLCELAEKDPRVVGITPAMASGCGMNRFAERFPERFFDVGIEEEHAVTFSAGLAAGGLRPFCNIYSSFSQRAYDCIIHDVALQRLPVVLCFDRAGLVGEDGATHHGVFDLAAYRSVPDTIVCAPRDETALARLMHTALAHDRGPFIIRYPRGTGEGVPWQDAPRTPWPVGQGETLLEGDTVALIGLGPVVNRALEAAARFPGRVGVYDFCYLKPLDEALLNTIAQRYRHIITLEDGTLKGGLFGAVSEALAPCPGGPSVEGLGIPDRFIGQARQTEQRTACGLDSDSISKNIEKVLQSCK
ncbi:MAG: 1-deoxy-D-xylulose-5-phosphate synthase [Bacteroidales bacterium]|nr:1-deoxy-D-xylulose-5-phosphate synthase [Bacteroidales bacterium]